MRNRLLVTSLLSMLLAIVSAGCMETAPKTADAQQSAPAQAGGPTFGNASPTAGSSTSAKANAAADAASYKEVEYKNVAKKGPALIVIPGEIKSNNATFTQRILPNNIADFGELELSQANFTVLERADLGNLLGEISLAYNLGNRSGPTNLNSRISGNPSYFESSGVSRAYWNFHYETEEEDHSSAPSTAYPHSRIQGPRSPCRIARRQDHGPAVPRV